MKRIVVFLCVSCGFPLGFPLGFLHHCGSPSRFMRVSSGFPLGFLHHCGSPSRFMRVSSGFPDRFPASLWFSFANHMMGFLWVSSRFPASLWFSFAFHAGFL